MAFYILEQNLVLHAGHEDLECNEDEKRHRLHSLGVISLLGIGFHSLLDGLIIGAGFLESTTIGLIATIGVISHELPEGLSITGLLFHAGFSRNRGLFYSIIAALATPVGAVVSSLLSEGSSLASWGPSWALLRARFCTSLPRTSSPRRASIVALTSSLCSWANGHLIRLGVGSQVDL